MSYFSGKKIIFPLPPFKQMRKSLIQHQKYINLAMQLSKNLILIMNCSKSTRSNYKVVNVILSTNQYIIFQPN